MTSKTFHCPIDSRFRLELFFGEFNPDDPGASTPVMVYGPGTFQATWHGATNYAEMFNDDGDVMPVPARIEEWLADMEKVIDREFGERGEEWN